MKTLYISGGRVFDSLEAACQYAGFIFRVSGLVVAVEILEKGEA